LEIPVFFIDEENERVENGVERDALLRAEMPFG